MTLSDVYQILSPDDRVQKGDQWGLASMAGDHIWAPCDSFVGRFVRDISDGGKIIFRRCIAKDEVQA